MVLGIQIAGFLFGMFMLYYSFIHYKRKEFTAKEFSFWMVLWVLFIIVALFPSVLDPVAKIGGFFRVLDVLIVSGFIFLIAITFYTYAMTKKIQKKVEAVVSEIAIKRNKRK